ncbi:MAG: carboxypeptidase regulatory-like domain-containing protein [Acidobacteriaceae bacterium]|nr:carboxypeptidase regulatory-like domain-containing protein [Acidobacteriaceae bacterium]
MLVILLCALGTHRVHAQAFARLDGIVADPGQAAVPGAKITIRNADTGVITTQISDSSGQYVFPSVLPGTYKLTVQMAGFKTWVRSVVVHANDHVTANVPMLLGDVSTTVTVTASTDQLDSGQRSETLTSEQIKNLATLGRNAEELVPLLPGVVQNGSSSYNSSFGGGTTSSEQGVDGFNINGNRSDSNTFKLDGGNMDDLTGNNGSNIYPNSEFISEITVETSNFTADQGGSPVLITAITKSGTKDFHGEGYYIGRNAIFDGNDWSNNYAGMARPDNRFNYSGFALSGPIILPGVKYNRGPEKKLFFFFGTEFSRQNPDPGTVLSNVPTQAMLGGDFSQIVFSTTCENARAAGNAGATFYLQHPCQINDPLTGNTLDKQNGRLTGSTGSGTGLLKSLMGPGLAGPNYTDPTGQWNYAASPAHPVNINQYVGRFDWDPSDKARFYVRVARQDETDVKPWGEYVSAGSNWTSNVPEPSPTISKYNSRSLNINMVNVLSPSLTNEFSFNTNVLRQPNAYQDPSILNRDSLGVNFSGIYSNGYPQVAQIVPAFAVCDSLNTSGCGASYAPPATGRWGESNLVGQGNFYKQTQFEFSDNLTKVVGAHNLKFGGLIGRARNDQNEASEPLEGYLVPSTWSGVTTGDEYADILTEHFSEFEQANHDVRGKLRSSSFEWYGQDSWKIRKNLTLEFGARWTLQGPWYDAAGLGSTFDPSAYVKTSNSTVYNGVRTASCSNPGQSAVPLCGTIAKTIRKYPIPLTQPRVGFSWDTTGRGQTILRGGFGIYTQRDPTNAGFGALLGPPNMQVATICCSLANLAAYAAAVPSAQGAFTYGQSNAVYDPRDGASPMIYQFNLTVSQALSHHLNAEMAYVGSQSRNMQLEQNIDNVAPGALWTPGTHLVSTDVQGNEGNYAPYTPFKQIVQIQHTGTANYNALQATLKRSSSRNFDFLASYTYSKAMGDSDQFQTLLANPFSNTGSYHVLSFDRTHLFSLGAQWYVPKLARGSLLSNSVARGVLNGWMFSGIAKAQSGGPIAISAYVSCVQDGKPCAQSIWSAQDTWFGTNAWSNAFLPGSTTSPPNGIYPVYTCDPRQAHGGIGSRFLNTDCVKLPAFGQQGAINPPYMKGPGSSDYDIALQKSFPLGGDGARHLDIRISSFNFLNRGQLNAINTVADFNYVLPADATDPSQGTATLTNGNSPCNGSVGGLGYSCGKTGSRQMEGSAKIFF